MLAETVNAVAELDEHDEFNRHFEAARIAAGPHLPISLAGKVELSAFQTWALAFIAKHHRGDEAAAGTIALADGRVRVASPGTLFDWDTDETLAVSFIDYAADVADVYGILGY